MRQETILKTWLKFEELSDKSKEKALEKHREINVNTEHWYESIFEEYKEKLEKLGFYDIDLYFSGFWSQGDGASFKAKHKKGTIYKTGRYEHEMSMRCDESKELLETARKVARQLYKSLEKEYEYQTSNEAVAESIIANDLEFDSDLYEQKT